MIARPRPWAAALYVVVALVLPFVAPAYALTLAVMGLNLFWAKRLLSRSRQAARHRLAIEAETRFAEEAST